jgi:hypothetical protein
VQFRILLQFDYSQTLTQMLKQCLPGISWSKTWKSWHFPYDKASYGAALEILRPYARIEIVKQENEKDIFTVPPKQAPLPSNDATEEFIQL